MSEPITVNDIILFVLLACALLFVVLPFLVFCAVYPVLRWADKHEKPPIRSWVDDDEY